MQNKPVYLFVTPFFPSPESWRGAFCFDLVKALNTDGRYDVRVFTPGENDVYEINGIRVWRFPWKILPSSILPFLFRRYNERHFLSRVLESGVKLQDVAVVHVHTALFLPYALAIKQINRNCLTLLHHHDPASFGLNLGRLRHFWPHKLVLFLQLRAMHDQIDCHVFISKRVEANFRAAPKCVERYYDEYRRQMRGLGWMRSVKVKNSIVLYNGVDRELFRPFSRPSRSVFEIGCVGNFVDWKDQLTLIKAIERLRDTSVWDDPGVKRPHVRFIGTGPTLSYCLDYVVRHKLEDFFEFEREVVHECLPAFYQSIDLFVLPSYFEGFGCVFTEAWSSGAPFITCEGQAMDDLLDDEDRRQWTFPPCDFAALAELILRLLRRGSNLSTPRLTQDVDFKVTVPRFLRQIEELV